MTPVATPFFFYFLSGIAIISAVVMVTKINPVHSALLLVAAVGAVVLAKRSLKYVDRPQLTPAAHEHDAPDTDGDAHDAASHGGGH